MEMSLSRMFSDYKAGKPVDNFQLTIQFKYILEKDLSLEEFSKWFLFANERLNKYNISFASYYKRINFLKTDEILATNFYYFANNIISNYKNINETLYKNLELITLEYELGPICFSTPELGRWSTIGGLGVMVDELTQGLVKLGKEVIVATPYYEKNKKGEIGYLSKDPAGFKYIGNIDVLLGKT